MDSRRLAAIGTTVAFGLPVAISLWAAFLGITTRGLWQDELYTGWTVDPTIGLGGVIERAIRDVNTPLYYFLLWPFVRIWGADEMGLRLFSALCAVAAVGLFVLGGRPFFSLRARLFAAAMATGSSFWFTQAQNARSYGLGMLVGTALLLLALAALARPHVSRATHWLFATMALASFIHFYLFFLSMAVLAVLFVLRPQQRVAAVACGCALLISVLLYLDLVISTFSHFSTDENWIPNDPAWYAFQLRTVLRETLTKMAMLALAICLLPAALGLAKRRRPAATSDDKRGILLCVTVPLLVVAAGAAGSLLVAPNFHSRYLLVSSPFIWGLFAFCYDRSMPQAPPSWRLGLDLLLAATLLWMAGTMAANRTKSSVEPFRETAAWIAAIPGCRGQEIPAVVTEQRRWFRSDAGLEPIRAGYEWYLGSFAPVRPLYLEDILDGKIPENIKQALTRRIDGDGCPVLAWVVHGGTREIAASIGKAILAATDRAARAPDLELIVLRTGLEGYILAMRRSL